MVNGALIGRPARSRPRSRRRQEHVCDAMQQAPICRLPVSRALDGNDHQLTKGAKSFGMGDAPRLLRHG